MANNYIAKGRSITCTAPTGGVVSGSLYLIESMFGVAAGSADTGESLELQLGGVWQLPKNVGTGFSVGDLAYWSGTEVVAASTGLTKIGVAVQEVDTSGLTVAVRLNAAF